MNSSGSRRLVSLAIVLVGLSGATSSPPALAQDTDVRIPFESLTILPERAVVTFTAEGRPTVVWGHLRVPPGGSGRAPAVIMAHGCGGAGANLSRWAGELNNWGVASFIVDSFAPRGIREICTGQQTINVGSTIVDMYRALEVLAAHPRVDPARIALIGWSAGGRVAIWSSLIRAQRTWMRAGSPQFVGFLAFYPASCFIKLRDEEQVVDRPIRILHGSAEDWIPVAHCREYVARMQKAGKDVALIEYPGAYHAFDYPGIPSLTRDPNVLNPGRCTYVELPDGSIVDPDGRPLRESPCLGRGGTRGYNAEAHRKAVQDVRGFLQQVFQLK